MINTGGSFSLAGKRGLIIGLANEHSIAYGCAAVLKKMGASLVVSCVNEKAQTFVAPLAAELEAPLIVCNVEQDDALESLVNASVSHLGQIDFLIHSIAWAPKEDLQGRVIDSSAAGFLQAMNISCHSFARLARLCEPHLSQSASLITMSYLGADEAVAHYGLMGPVKAALESLVRYLAMEMGQHGHRVHAMSPGPVPTRAASGLQDFDALMSKAVARSPLRRLVSLDEIGQLAAFLVSDASSGMTGQTLYVDAGYHIVN
ncbi:MULTISPECIES: enoyl-ACP reductase FabI [unclassified Undibacterium]|uniref:enoyl-ACP reductase FabI n=1 Tax=unclassified Undibacterium TaxID=2630295 RepID=UPI00164BFDF9|nr:MULTISPECIES: enoyl-ACP reductase FabI [unclassified Undibacterium]MBC3929093.1 enoyl-ACP reductase FabI [Undibacterium sp. CY21W]MBK1890612.1 enoyl-ACP reductase FabI [Undibacterium sp. 14-3-2]